jgi:hypothetical protein
MTLLNMRKRPLNTLEFTTLNKPKHVYTSEVNPYAAYAKKKRQLQMEVESSQPALGAGSAQPPASPASAGLSLAATMPLLEMEVLARQSRILTTECSQHSIQEPAFFSVFHVQTTTLDERK